MFAIINGKNQIESSNDIYDEKNQATMICNVMNSNPMYKHKPYTTTRVNVSPVGGWKEYKTKKK